MPPFTVVSLSQKQFCTSSQENMPSENCGTTRGGQGLCDKNKIKTKHKKGKLFLFEI